MLPPDLSLIFTTPDLLTSEEPIHETSHVALAALSAWDILTPWTLLWLQRPRQGVDLRSHWFSLLSVLCVPHRPGVFLETRKSVFLMEMKDKNQAQYPGRVVYTCDFSNQKWGQEDEEFKTSLGYMRLSLKKEKKKPHH